MKVCMLTTSFPKYVGHGQSSFLYELCDGLAKKGIQLDIVTPTDDKKIINTFPKMRVHRFYYFFSPKLQKLTRGGGIPGNLRSSWMARFQFPFFFLAFVARSREYAKNADIIHAQWS